jgi:hypothetical protein
MPSVTLGRREALGAAGQCQAEPPVGLLAFGARDLRAGGGWAIRGNSSPPCSDVDSDANMRREKMPSKKMPASLAACRC